jgi:hypothetical protein
LHTPAELSLQPHPPYPLIPETPPQLVQLGGLTVSPQGTALHGLRFGQLGAQLLLHACLSTTCQSTQGGRARVSGTNVQYHHTNTVYVLYICM